ncbi:DUF350 domain-containing protein [Indiicoccus explosivorum]|uniref:DUF350 domain-containing protein n=1 Tax=Indiicoccus explosivorum TaxID=1917864 RepID=UPI000B444B41|nr:DUF350 domain-containing protein [Indiicoccus explosivorum]
MNPFLLTFLYFAAAVAVIVVGLFVFELMTRKYKDWEEVKNRNTAVALSIAGKIIGTSIIIAFAIFHNDTIWQTVVWGLYGLALQLIAYLLFEVLTPRFSVEQQLKENNTATGIIAFAVSVGLAFVIGASIT